MTVEPSGFVHFSAADNKPIGGVSGADPILRERCEREGDRKRSEAAARY